MEGHSKIPSSTTSIRLLRLVVQGEWYPQTVKGDLEERDLLTRPPQ